MKFTQPVTIKYIEDGNWFLFGIAQDRNNKMNIVVSLIEIVDPLLLLPPKERDENLLFYFKTANIENFSKCQNIVLPKGVLEMQLNKNIYKAVEFDDENEEAKFYLLNS